MEDISRTTIVSLVILTLAVSMVGTWLVLSEMSNTQPRYVYEEPSAGKVQVEILTSDQYNQYVYSTTQGTVGVTIEES